MRRMTRLPLDDDSLVLPDEIEDIGGAVCAAASLVVKELGAGMRERIYQDAMAHILREEGRRVDVEVPVQIAFRGKPLGVAYRMDLLVDHRVVIEIKSVPEVHPSTEAQLLTYMRGAKLPLGYIVNFGAPAGRRWIFRRALTAHA